MLGPDTPAAARLENIARFIDSVGESTSRAAEQAHEILYAKPQRTPDSTATPTLKPRPANRPSPRSRPGGGQFPPPGLIPATPGPHCASTALLHSQAAMNRASQLHRTAHRLTRFALAFPTTELPLRAGDMTA